MTEFLEILAPAKINLWLRVLAREESGYHSLESLFTAISLADRLVIGLTPTPGIELKVSGEGDTGPNEKNLVHRAAAAFLARHPSRGGVRIELEKVIPTAAGLGGGSSDAAATLRGLNHLFGGPLLPANLLDIAIRLGSDVPFFLADTPFALAWGRGERLLALPTPPARQVLIAHPGVAVPTADAFRRLAELRGGSRVPQARALSLEALSSWEGICGLAENDFETPAFERIPRLVEARAVLLDAGASIALLAGSGGSLFGIFEMSADLGPAAAELESRGWRCWSEQTLQQWPIPRPRD